MPTLTHVFAGMRVSDYGRSRSWYERLLGHRPDMVPHDAEAAWELAGKGWLYILADERSGHGLVTLLVEDLDREVAALAQRGLDPDTSESLPGAGRKASFDDPDGNRITFAQPGG